MPNGDHGPPYHSEQPLFSERLYADAKERIRLLELEVAEARRCPGCGASAGTVHMGCVVCDQRSRAEKAEAERNAARTANESCLANMYEQRNRAEAAEAEVARLRVIAQVAHDVIIKAPADVQKEFLEGIARGVAAKEAT